MRACPALLTRMSQRPIHCSTAVLNRPTASLSSTLQGKASSWLDAALPVSDALAAASRASSRPQIATAAPSARNRRAVASPIPDVPPVTTATLSCSPRSMRVPSLPGFGECPLRACLAVGLDPSQPTGNLCAGVAQFIVDEGPSPLVLERGDGARHVDRGKRGAGEIEHRHRRRADAALEMRLAPGDAGAAVLLRLATERLDRCPGMIAEALQLLAGEAPLD